MLTPIEQFENFYLKREDLAGYKNDNWPAGAKMRQFKTMIEAALPGTPLAVGCSAFSAMQIYVAAAAKEYKRKAFIFVPARKAPSKATQWALAQGAKVVFVRPGYPSIYRKAARDKAAALGGVIRWNFRLAVLDTAAQTANIPENINRIVVPTGSGLTAAGVILGLQKLPWAKQNKPTVVAVAVSPISSAEKIWKTVETCGGLRNFQPIKLEFISPHSKYEKPEYVQNFDPFYAAKAYSALTPESLLWVSGRRPTSCF